MHFAFVATAATALLSISGFARPTDPFDRRALLARQDKDVPDVKPVAEPTKPAEPPTPAADAPGKESPGVLGCATSILNLPQYKAANKCLGLDEIRELHALNTTDMAPWEKYLGTFCAATECTDDALKFVSGILNNDCVEHVTELIPGGGIARKVLELVIDSGPLVRSTFCARNTKTNDFCFVDVARGFGDMAESIFELPIFKTDKSDKGKDEGKDENKDDKDNKDNENNKDEENKDKRSLDQITTLSELRKRDLSQLSERQLAGVFSQIATLPKMFAGVDTDVLCSECMSGFYFQAKTFLGLTSGSFADLGGMGCGADFGKKKPSTILTNQNGTANATATAISGGPFKAMLCVDPTATISISTVVQTVIQTVTVTAGAEPSDPTSTEVSKPSGDAQPSGDEPAPTSGEPTPSSGEPTPSSGEPTSGEPTSTSEEPAPTTSA